ncbi:MAG: hypothetical protein R3F62_18295 [Planctomycetota bacterium]
MRRLKNTVGVHSYDPKTFLRIVGERSRLAPGGQPVLQARYLANYLTELGARTLLVESHYVDRHYVEEYSLYYSKCLSPPPAYCSRLLIFGIEVDEAQFDNWLTPTQLASEGPAPEDATPALGDHFLGYVVIRPLPEVPIGRTVLSQWEAKPGRKILSTVRYFAHPFGTRLEVKGLAFQQQDAGVAACATTAAWTALQRVCRNEGSRPPTPSEVTQAAVRFSISEGRAFPQTGGLTTGQLCEAVRSFGHSPLVLKCPQLGLEKPQPTEPEQVTYFHFMVRAYVRSGIPVILTVKNSRGEGHAVTIVGDGAEEAWERAPISKFDKTSLRVLNLSSTKLYVHDDRLGPYARSLLAWNGEHLQLRIDRRSVLGPGQSGGGETEERVIHAIVPLYPKLRLPAEGLLRAFAGLYGSLRSAFEGATAADLGMEVRFDRSGSYLADVAKEVSSPSRFAAFRKSVVLSRYVGVVRFLYQGTAVVDTIWDGTDTVRGARPGTGLLLAFVTLEEQFKRQTSSLAVSEGVPWC